MSQADSTLTLCSRVLEMISLLTPLMGLEITCSKLLPTLITLSKDRVSNIKFNVVKVLQLLIPIVDHSVSRKIVKVEEKLAKGWGGENAYHMKGYRYLLVDGDRSISRASPPRKSNNPNEGLSIDENKLWLLFHGYLCCRDPILNVSDLSIEASRNLGLFLYQLRQVTCRLLGVILEESTPQELQVTRLIEAGVHWS
ncbi:unnamed protein product [Lactuca saligna]|uniref:Uncharacterized protein n=1 Tax=Lactuca saligna TaxID=75948 RepID=A0AA35YDK7_LACSI|nr:unnamed protein product [Lactuca saligna]